jgi:hypothetical protein
MQQSFAFAPLTGATKTPATKLAPQALAVAVALDRGSKVEFPKNANAVRVVIDNKTTVILKPDADTLKGVGVATAVEFGIVKNDAKGHPIRKEFTALAAVTPKKTKPAKLRLVNDGKPLGGDFLPLLAVERVRLPR